MLVVASFHHDKVHMYAIGTSKLANSYSIDSSLDSLSLLEMQHGKEAAVEAEMPAAEDAEEAVEGGTTK